jgi:hypothetical protein
MKHFKYFLFVSVFYFSCKEPEVKKDVLTSEQTVKTACILSQLAYCSQAGRTIKKYLPEWKIVWDAEPVGGNYAFIATDGNMFGIAIRGSLLEFNWDAFQNWFYQDLNITTMKKWEYAEIGEKAAVALGSYEGWENLTTLKDKVTGRSLWDFLLSDTKKNSPIIITGHSLGGNLASVYGSFLRNNLKIKNIQRENINVITFGAPAAGNKTFADDFDHKFPKGLRFENTLDPAPKYPCRGKISGLGKTFSKGPNASEILVGYKNITVPLSNVFMTLDAALILIDLKNGGSYTQPAGKPITIPFSNQYKNNSIEDWLGEAAYQHFMEQYARHFGAPVINCTME